MEQHVAPEPKNQIGDRGRGLHQKLLDQQLWGDTGEHDRPLDLDLSAKKTSNMPAGRRCLTLHLPKHNIRWGGQPSNVESERP